jgi:hypothetical protein
MDEARIRQKLLEIAGNAKHVRFRDIENLLDNHIGPRFPDYNHHGSPHHAFTVGGLTFNVAEPRKGEFVKECYVKKFLHRMDLLGLCDLED